MLQCEVQLDRGTFRLDAAFKQNGRITGVFGPSGAGKSTLIHVLAGLQSPDSGRIVLEDHVLLDASRGVDVPPHRRAVGVVFQDDRLFPHRSVLGNLRYGAKLTRNRTPLIDESGVIELLSLGSLLDRRPAALSGGERQRVALGRALLASPRLLLLDEPLSSLDQSLKRQILPFLRRVRDRLDIPMLYVSHDLAEILQLTDDVLVLDHGRVVGHGSVAGLIRTPAALDVIHPRGLTNVLTLAVIGSEAGPNEAPMRLLLDPADPSRSLIGPPARLEPGSHVRIAIRPTDVSLASGRVDGISIRNQVRGIVDDATEHDGRVLVTVDCGRPITAEVSRAAAAELSLGPGREVWCLIKSNAIMWLDDPGSVR